MLLLVSEVDLGRRYWWAGGAWLLGCESGGSAVVVWKEVTQADDMAIVAWCFYLIAIPEVLSAESIATKV